MKTIQQRFTDAITLLTEFIVHRTKNIEFYTLEKTTNDFIEFMLIGKPYQISLEGNSTSIYGNEFINTLGRVWHDDVHYWHELDFGFEDERQCCHIQSIEFMAWCIESIKDKETSLDAMQILYNDIVSQYEYYIEKRKYVKDQYKFVFNKFKEKVIENG